MVLRRIVLCALLALAALAPAAARDPAAAPYRWTNVTVEGGGFAPGIVFSPVERGLAYLRTDMGGAYRWEDKTGTWTPLTDGIAEGSYFGVESIAPDPVAPDRVYAAVGMSFRGAAAMLRSDDRGAHWRTVPVPFRMGGNEPGRGLGERLAVDPRDTRQLLFGSRHDGLWRSDDAGLHWRRDEAFPYAGAGAPSPRETHAGIGFVLFDRGRSRVFAGIADAGSAGLLRSDDDGRSWSRVAGGPSGLLPIKAAIDATGRLYVTYADGIGPGGVTRGAVWALEPSGEFHDVAPDPRADAPPGGYIGITADPKRGGVAYASTFNRWKPGDTLWRTTDGGRHWTDLGPLSRRDTRATPFLNWGRPEAALGHWIAGLALDPFDPARLAYTTGDTVYVTNDAPKPALLWTPWTKGVEQTAIITLTSPTAGAHLVSGFGDLGGFVHRDFGRSPPEGMFLSPRNTNTNSLDYAGRAGLVLVRSGNVHDGQEIEAGLGWSDDGGASWHPLRTLLWNDGHGLEAQGKAPITVSADGQSFFVAAERPLLTRDRGKSWIEIAGLPGNLRIVADKVDARLAWAMDPDTRQIFASVDGGEHFAPMATRGLCADLSLTRPRNRESQPALVASPFAPGDLFLLCGTELYRSRDGGRAFTRLAPDLDIALFGLGLGSSPANPAIYAVATHAGETGIWRSADGGAHWARIDDAGHRWGGRFRVISGDPRLRGRVYVGTDGRGILYGDPAG
jgi:photosystem II stability/assembly factor-like uncharacterized protein